MCHVYLSYSISLPLLLCLSKLIRASISDFGRPFKLLIQSFNLAQNIYCNIVSILTCFSCYMYRCFSAIDWLILECTDGNQRNEISSLFNALLLWDISICSTILRIYILLKKIRWVHQKGGADKHDAKKKREIKGK